MKKNLFLLLILIFMSCTTEEQKYESYITEKASDLIAKQNEDYSHIIILPGQGCSGCINVAESFFKSNYHRSELLFVFTNLNSLKILKHKIGIDITGLSNVIIDTENTFFMQENINTTYPVIIYYSVKERKIEKFDYQKPMNDAFRKLEML